MKEAQSERKTVWLKEKKSKKQKWTAWYYLRILWLKPKTFEFLQSGEEETNSTHLCGAYTVVSSFSRTVSYGTNSDQECKSLTLSPLDVIMGNHLGEYI